MRRFGFSIHTPATRLDMARRTLARPGALVASLGAVTTTLALGWSGDTPLPGPGSAVTTALIAIAGCGLIAWHLARLSALPLVDPVRAALTASLIAAASTPFMTLHALILPMSLSIWAGWRRNDQRLIALMVHCGAGLAWALWSVNHIGASSLTVTILGIACFMAQKGLAGAANDNPSMKRIAANNPLWSDAGHGNKGLAPIPGKWGVSNVQQ